MGKVTALHKTHRCVIFLLKEAVEVRTLELAEVPVPGEETVKDPLDVRTVLEKQNLVLCKTGSL